MLYQTITKINVDNARFNIEGIRKAIGPDRKIMVSVKANAYGHGAIEISRLAEKTGVDWLGVATVPEGIELRQAGIQLPILKLSPAFPAAMEAAIEHNISLTICDKDNIDQLDATCARLDKSLNVHMKIETGMGRIGVAIEEAVQLAEYVENKCPHLNLEGISTHLPVSEESDQNYTLDQVNRFKTVIDQINLSIGRKVHLTHCSNSGAILGHPYSWLDMVRPGIMVYGYYPGDDALRSIPLKPVLSFVTMVSFLKKVKAGTTIGYGRTWTAPEDTWIATISAGYADGFNRLFSNKGRVLIKGRSYPIVGRVCMDQSMVNLGPATEVEVGDEVVLIGKSGKEVITCEEWAKQLNTITYEITCQINARVDRIVIHDDNPE